MIILDTSTQEGVQAASFTGAEKYQRLTVLPRTSLKVIVDWQEEEKN